MIVHYYSFFTKIVYSLFGQDRRGGRTHQQSRGRPRKHATPRRIPEMPPRRAQRHNTRQKTDQRGRPHENVLQKLPQREAVRRPHERHPHVHQDEEERAESQLPEVPLHFSLGKKQSGGNPGQGLHEDRLPGGGVDPVPRSVGRDEKLDRDDQGDHRGSFEGKEDVEEGEFGS